MSDGDPKLEDLNRDRVGHEDKQLRTDQGVKIEHTDDSRAAVIRWITARRAGSPSSPSAGPGWATWGKKLPASGAFLPHVG